MRPGCCTSVIACKSMPYPLSQKLRCGCVAPDKFFSENFFSPNFARMADFAVWRCIFGSFQQNRINLYIKSYENRRFFGVFRRYGCIFYVFFCSISYWFTVFFVDFVVLICIYTKLCVWFRHAFFRICSI